MNREQGVHEIERTRIIAIIRGIGERHAVNVAKALKNGGIPVMEVTLNTDGALTMIDRLQAECGGDMFIGAGTVLDLNDAQEAIRAGASFLVTPNTDTEVIRYAAERQIPIYPGAMTPSEIVTAWKAGATAVKIFPGASLGMAYLKELQGPLQHIPMIAVGGVTEQNIADFLNICYAVGIGSSLINKQQIESENYAWVEEHASRLSDKVQGLLL